MSNAAIDYSLMSIDERIKLAEKIYVIYPCLQEVFTKIGRCHQRSKRPSEPRCLFISGMSGCGKTSSAEYYLKDFPRIETDEGTVVPVLFSSILSPATDKSVVTGLLESIGDPCSYRGTVVSQTLRLIKLIKKCKVELIILDEFQHLIDRESAKILQNAANWLKTLINETQIPMVLLGMPWSDVILRANSQLKRRFQARLELNPFNWKTPEGQNDFRKLLKMIEERLPLMERSNLADFNMAFRCFCASGGIIFNVMRIIRTATEIALTLKQEKLTLDCLAQAYEEEIGLTDIQSGNPFEVKEDKLTIPFEEPLETWDVFRSKRRKAENKKQKISDILTA